MPYKDPEKRRERDQEYYKANIEKIRARGKRYREANRDKIIEKKREYYKANLERLLEQKRKYYEANRDKIRERQLEYREANIHKINEQKREYSEAHPEKASERLHKFARTHPEYYREYSRTYREVNPEKVRECHQKWYEANPEKLRIYSQNRRARIKGNGGSFSLDELNALFEEQEGFCFYCGKLLYESFETPYHIEHKLPISRGGLNNIDNIALSCQKCNSKKHDKTHEEFLKQKMEVQNGTMCRILLEGWQGRHVGDGVMLGELEVVPLIEKGIVETYDGREIVPPHNFRFIGNNTTTRGR